MASQIFEVIMSNEQTLNPTEVSPEAITEEQLVQAEVQPDEISAAQLFHPAEVISDKEPDIEEIDISSAQELDDYTPEERAHWMARYNETMKVFRAGELVKGRIVSINDTEVTVDIGFKSEGSIPKTEFKNLEELKVGDEIEVFIDSIEDSEGTLVLSKEKAEFMRTWEKIRKLYETGEMVEAKIIRRIKGGMVVDLFGVESFLPGSQIDVHPIRDFDALVNVTMDFRIIKINEARKNVVLSHKVLVEESLREIRQKVLEELEVGQVVEGVVKNITDFGVFVDLGGVDGLIHITDLSWGRISHPSDVVKLDERIKVKVLQYDKEKQRISLGMKQLQEHHWDEVDIKYPINSRTKGKVISIVKYGAFVELEPGIEGLVHISEMSWTQHIKHPSQLVSVGDEIDVVILSIDKENRKISMGMKQIEEDPWERLEKTYQPGTRHIGRVRDLVPFGAFIELEPGIDGLIHISDLSWTRKVRHPGEIVKKGQELEVVVLGFDKNERRIALGLKQLEEDPWDKFEREYALHTKTDGTVVRLLEKGVVVMLPMGVEGFVPNSQLGKEYAGDSKKTLKEGDNLELEVIEFDKSNHRIVLSHLLVEKAKEKTALRQYQDTAEEVKTTIGDVVPIETISEQTVETEATSEPVVEPVKKSKQLKGKKATTAEKSPAVKEDLVEPQIDSSKASEEQSMVESPELDIKSDESSYNETNVDNIEQNEALEKQDVSDIVDRNDITKTVLNTDNVDITENKDIPLDSQSQVEPVKPDDANT